MKAELINVTVVPAQPGYKLIGGIEMDAEYIAEYGDTIPPDWMHDIIAWRVTTHQRPDESLYSFAEAITAEGCYSGEYGILRPDGVIEQPFGNPFKSVAHYVKNEREKSDGSDA